jgi:membrane fusion protein, heavy metal efflux system
LKRLLTATAIAAHALAFAMVTAAAAADAPPDAASQLPRVEARSGDLLAVGVVHGDNMSIRVSRLVDNAPVRDAAITVILRGMAHPATAETDGSYSLKTGDLALPGAAAVEFQVSQGAARESLKGTLEIGAAGGADDKNNARQLWWWVLNFAVCFGVLWLISRRRKAARS